MDSTKNKQINFEKALATLQIAIANYQSTEKNEHITGAGTLDREDLLLALRDSMIQRFEYTLEAWWKYLRTYLENEQGTLLKIVGPRGVIRAACQARVISEDEAATCMQMIESRNMTSHIYKEEVAQMLVADLPVYCKFLEQMAQRLSTL